MSETTAMQDDEKKPRAKRSAAAVGLHVYAAINEVKKELEAGGGITKDRVAQAGGTYNFRGIDDMYNVLCGLTAKHGLCLFPRVTKRDVTFHERMKEGKVVGFQTHALVDMEIDIVSQVDGSSHTIATCGEGLDTSDKALNKAMSGGMKYACIMAFLIPTHGEMVDSEVDDIPVQPTPKANGKPAATPKAAAVAKAIERVEPKQPNPPLDTSEAATEEVVGLTDAVSKANTAKLLWDLYKMASDLAEPGRGVVVGHVHARIAVLLETAPQDDLSGWKDFVGALGKPKALMSAFNARYNFFKQQQANAS